MNVIRIIRSITFFLILIINICSYGQTKYAYNGKWKKSKTLPFEKKETVTSLRLTNYSDSIFPTDELLQFENLEAISIYGRYNNDSEISDIKIKKFRIDKRKLSKLKKLRHIWLGSLCFDGFPSELSIIKDLEILEIYYSNIDHVPSEIKEFRSLKELRLSGNRVESICVEIGHLDSLKKLYLESNHFTQFPESLLHIPDIEEISFDNLIGMGAFVNEFDYQEILPFLREIVKIRSLKGIIIPVKYYADSQKLTEILKTEKIIEKVLITYNNP